MDETLTNSIQARTFDADLREETTDAGGLYAPSRVISTISPVVVRRDDPRGPIYQEALGYRFLLNRCAFPGLRRMDNGTLVLTVQAMLDWPSERRTGLILFSTDEGESWSQPKRIGMRRCTPINLGGDKLLLHGFPVSADHPNEESRSSLCFSDDAGSTWSDPEPIPLLADGQTANSDVAYHPLVEGQTVTWLFWTRIGPDSNFYRGEPFSQTLLRRYHIDDHRWDEPIFLPREWHLNEGSLLRAADGALLAVVRTRMIGRVVPDDHWMGMATTRSTDDGRTWTTPARHFHYGHHHCSLQNLPDGRILLTYVARIGRLDGRTYHGVEAVVSYDHGVTWDWPRRYIIFRTSDNCPHSPQSAVLPDGRILTVFMDHTRSSWTDDPNADRNSPAFHGVSRVCAVIWSMPPANQSRPERTT